MGVLSLSKSDGNNVEATGRTSRCLHAIQKYEVFNTHAHTQNFQYDSAAVNDKFMLEEKKPRRFDES